MYIFGYEIFDSDKNNLVNKLFKEDITQKIIFALNPNKIVMGIENDKIYNIINSANYLIPDGYGIVLVANIVKPHALERITGIDLMLSICEKAAINNKKLFLYGGSQESITKTKYQLERMYSGINIVGYVNGYSIIANNELIEKINDSKAEILFVALGSIKQEDWIINNKKKLSNITIIQGVGGSFDVISGKLKRAPVFFIKHNLEWLYRILQEPRRINIIFYIIKYIKCSIKVIGNFKKNKKDIT